MPTFDLAVRMHDDLEDDQEMITPYQFGQLMVDWTNPRKAAEMSEFNPFFKKEIFEWLTY